MAAVQRVELMYSVTDCVHNELGWKVAKACPEKHAGVIRPSEAPVQVNNNNLCLCSLKFKGHKGAICKIQCFNTKSAVYLIGIMGTGNFGDAQNGSIL